MPGGMFERSYTIGQRTGPRIARDGHIQSQEKPPNKAYAYQTNIRSSKLSLA
jgi:hypothetical protein